MKAIFICLLLLLSLVVHGQEELTYTEWKEQAKTNSRLLPEYGHRPKSPGQMEADQKFMEASLKTDTTATRASAHLIDLGFRYFVRGDIKTAMYRFNQAWLMNPRNENVYWGFGAVYFHFQDLDAANRMYDQGLYINPNSTNILTDKATIYMAMLNEKYDKETLTTAVELLEKSYKINPLNPNTTFKLSTVYFSLEDCPLARRYYDECMKTGGKPITKEYTDAMNEKCK